jgi:hypothetical protein
MNMILGSAFPPRYKGALLRFNGAEKVTAGLNSKTKKRESKWEGLFMIKTS